MTEQYISPNMENRAELVECKHHADAASCFVGNLVRHFDFYLSREVCPHANAHPGINSKPAYLSHVCKITAAGIDSYYAKATTT